MRLICVSRYRSGYGSYEPGQDVDVTEEQAGLLLRDSPGSFKIPTPEKPKPVEESEAAMSTETKTGLTAPDRRARGGRKRRT